VTWIRPRVRGLFRLAVRRASLRERDVDEEIRLHVDLRAEQLVQEGWSPEAARVEARRRFALLLDDARARLLEAARNRDERMTWRDRIDSVKQDAASAVRQLRAAPGVAAAAVLTLALGIGANAAMFGVVDRLLLRPPEHVVEPQRVTRLYIERRRGGFGGNVSTSVSYPTYRAVRDSTRAFAGVAASYPSEYVVGEGEDARQVPALEVTGNFFALLGVRPALGRLIGPDDDRLPSGAHVAVLGERYWRRAFGASPNVLGTSIVVEGVRYEIVGVAPRGFTGVGLEPRDLFLPLSAMSWQARGHEWYAEGGMSWISMVGRVRPGVSFARAESEATRAVRAAVPDSTVSNGYDHGARVIAASSIQAREPVASEFRSSARVAAWLGGVAAVVLLVACANVANLLLARAVRRRREIAVRTALGAGRGRLARQLLAESTLVAALGGAAGLLVAWWGGAAVRTLLLPGVDWSEPPVSGRVLLFALAATTLTALLTGVVPVLHVAALGVTSGLRTGAREGGGRRARTRTALLVAQAALSVVLLAGAGLFVRSLLRVGAIDYGYDPERLLTVTVTLPDGGGPDVMPAAYDRMLERARRVPGVERAALSTTSPFWSMLAGELAIPGFDSLATLRDEFPLFNAVGPDYFATMGTRIVRGRALGAGDVLGAPRVVVVNEAMARRIWKGADPIGRCVKVDAVTAPCSEVVGVARTMLQSDLREKPVLEYFVPIAQKQKDVRMRTLFVRAAGPPQALVPTLRRELRAVVPEARYVDAAPFEERVDPQVRPWRLGATMFGLFGALALLIASVGLYSVLAYTVAQRLHEMGLRMALGARTRDVLALVLRQGLGVAAVGIALGAAAALAAGHWVAPLLFDVSPHDPVVFGGVTVVLLAAAAAAALVPARRATRANPSDALRSE
jgi:predicted permease